MGNASRRRRVGVAVVGLGGAVATTAVAGVELMRHGGNSMTGLPLADVAVPAPGSARITRRCPGCSWASIGYAMCRSRRETRWRTTALPTHFPTTRPTPYLKISDVCLYLRNLGRIFRGGVRTQQDDRPSLRPTPTLPFVDFRECAFWALR